MSQPVSDLRRHLTLVGITLLHAFTHAYGAILVPLYLLIATDLHLRGVGAVTLIVTLYGLTYCWGSYPAGVLADRIDRRWLLALGLIGNALAILGMGLTHQYWLLLVLGVLAGLFGTLFHPAAIALSAAHYPRNPGMAVGIMGAGSGLGFFFGPQIAGWRAQAGQWSLAGMSDWQRPLIELGLIGVVFGLVFIVIAAEAQARRQRMGKKGIASTSRGGDGAVPARQDPSLTAAARSDVPAPPGAERHEPLGPSLRGKIILLAAVLGWRDFSGAAQLSLASIYLQKACHLDVKYTGFLLGAMMLLGVVVNPLAVWLTPGRRRLPGLAMILVAAGLVVMTTPLWPVAWVFVGLCAFQTIQLSSYAVADAATMERINPAVRGRFVGLYLTAAGTLTAAAPWLMGSWTDRMGENAYRASAYLLPFGVLGVLMMFSALSTRLIRRLGEPTGMLIRPVEEIEPLTAGTVG